MTASAYVLVVRDPDAANQFTTDGDVTVVDIDLGSSFSGEPEDEDQAVEWVSGLGAVLDCLPVTTPVLGAAIDTYATAVEDFPNAAAIVQAYRVTRFGTGHDDAPRLMWALHTEAGDPLEEAAICSTCLVGEAEVSEVVEIAEDAEGYDQSGELHDASDEPKINCSKCGYKHRPTPPPAS